MVLVKKKDRVVVDHRKQRGFLSTKIGVARTDSRPWAEAFKFGGSIGAGVFPNNGAYDSTKSSRGDGASVMPLVVKR